MTMTGTYEEKERADNKKEKTYEVPYWRSGDVAYEAIHLGARVEGTSIVLTFVKKESTLNG
jgi:hypothetical protein